MLAMKMISLLSTTECSMQVAKSPIKKLSRRPRVRQPSVHDKGPAPSVTSCVQGADDDQLKSLSVLTMRELVRVASQMRSLYLNVNKVTSACVSYAFLVGLIRLNETYMFGICSLTSAEND